MFLGFFILKGKVTFVPLPHALYYTLGCCIALINHVDRCDVNFFLFTGVHTMIHAPAKPKLLVISGPSGSGKSTIIQKLFSEFPDRFGFSVSHNSRAPRAGEIDGVHYHFTSKEKIQKMIENEEFLESAAYTNHLCGTR